MTPKELKNEMVKAEKRVRAYDKIDKSTPRDFKTIIAAFECGLLTPDSGAQFDALFMLKHLAKLVDKQMAKN